MAFGHRSCLAAVVLAAVASIGLPGSAIASPHLTAAGHQKPAGKHLRSRPVVGTPHFPAVTKDTEQVRQLLQCGDTMYAVGSFSVVKQGKRSFVRHNAFSFAAVAPFKLTSWQPDVHGVVNSITFSRGDCGDAYLGGKFTAIGRHKAMNLAEVATKGVGAFVPGFRHFANKQVETLAAYQGHVLAGGFFSVINGSSADPKMASLNWQTGKDDGFLRLNVSGHYSYLGAAPNGTRIYNQQISHSSGLELVEGDFTRVGGRQRRQIFMLNLTSRPRATVTGWTSPRFDGSRGYPARGYYYNCTDKEPFYIRSAAWSPDDKTIYVASTGFRPWNDPSGFPLRGLCDAAAAFTASQKSASLRWINYDGCYSLYSVAADARTAYFAGHELWSQSPDGCKTFRTDPHAISAPGFEGLSPATGELAFNPTRSRGIGADDLLVTSAGLWIASDNFDGSQMCGKVGGLAGICFLPYQA